MAPRWALLLGVVTLAAVALRSFVAMGGPAISGGELRRSWPPTSGNNVRDEHRVEQHAELDEALAIRQRTSMRRSIPVRIAYCVNDHRQVFLPSPSEFIARTYGPHIFPRPRFSLTFRAVYTSPQDLPRGLPHTSEAALKLLGIDPETHVRFCERGSSGLAWMLQWKLGHVLTRTPNSTIFKRLQDAGLWDPPGSDGWMLNRTLFWPPKGLKHLIDSNTGLARLPLLFRTTMEPMYETAVGVAGTLDCKRELSSSDSATVYYPYMLYSTTYRMASYANFSDRHKYGHLDRIRTINDALNAYVRPPSFNATQQRLEKKYFASFVQGHCSNVDDIYFSTLIRDLFVFILAEKSGRAVSVLGGCPRGNLTRLGFTDVQLMRIRNEHSGQNVVQLHSKHKFAVAMENAAVEGYITEKIASAYLGQAVPIYFGSPQSVDVLNPKSFIACDVPPNLLSVASVSGARDFQSRLCANITSEQHNCTKRDEACIQTHERALKKKCYGLFASTFERMFTPSLALCASKVVALDASNEAYDVMLSQPLVPVDEGTRNVSGVWNPALIGRAIYAAFVGGGFLEALTAQQQPQGQAEEQLVWS